MVKEVKLFYINKELNINLRKENYVVNGKLDHENFNADYIFYCKKMYEKYQDPNVSEKFLHKLFTYKIDMLNDALHPDLSNYSNEEIQEAVEIYLDDKLENNKSNRIFCFYEEWKKN